ncbi:hypothetical protein [Corallococcus sp. Z5C101001]|uniref:hypothetical protein n=1 Tax=Corallococcus sp. Z5C101001 TaxID=2596829 RepID=UPI00117E0DA4|nr:hypothetical protein [Corallococcus sp. Z5C101001]TSC25912.1 hypothetical protein FOF48_23215 [Corallococcus sp. Z5C101001]
MSPSVEASWPDSLQALHARVAAAAPLEAVASSADWREDFARWVRGASLEERTRAQAAAWERLSPGERTPGELLFLLSTCSELLWPYAEPPPGLLKQLLARQRDAVSALREAGDSEGADRIQRETDAALSTVLTRYLKRHPDALSALVRGVPCTFDGRALRFQDAVEVDLKQVLGAGPKSVGLLEQLRALLPDTREEGRDRLSEFIRTRAARVPWREASEVLGERLFALATSPDGRSGMRGFLACYPNGRKEPDWCSRAGLLLARTVEVGGPPAVVENLCDLLTLFDAPPVDGLRGALGALVQSDFETAADLGHARFVLDHCHGTMRKNEPALALALLWLEERLFRASVRRGVPEAFERRTRARAKLAALPGFTHLVWLAEECAEMWPRFRTAARPGLDGLVAWRAEVAQRMGKKPVLRKAAIEFLLWCAPDEASSEAELATLALVRTATDRRLVRRMLEHPSPRARFRARALQSWLQAGAGQGKSPAPVEATEPATLTASLRHLHATRAVPVGGRTWLRDRDLEDLLVGAVGRVEAEAAQRHPERFREECSELVAGLLEGLRSELERVRVDLESLLGPGRSPPLSLAMAVRRQPSPPREGAAEVAIVVSVEREGFVRTRRVVRVPVAKLEQRGEGQWLPGFRLGRERLDALLAHTEAAFCLFLVPAFVRSECWVVPARLARALMDTQGALSGVPREAVQGASRSLAQWLVYDVLGLWVGDERPDVVTAACEGDSAAEFVVDLTVR